MQPLDWYSCTARAWKDIFISYGNIVHVFKVSRRGGVRGLPLTCVDKRNDAHERKVALHVQN